MSWAEAAEKHLLVRAIPPFSAYVATRERWTGRGIFELRFDYETGELREIHIVQSTGHRLLDGHAIAAFKLWRAKPRSIHILRVPLQFDAPTNDEAGGNLRKM